MPQPVDDALTFLLEHLPPQMHLVIATREDPQLPLARLRARGQLTELRAADLRFTPAEAAAFLNRGDGPRPLGGRHRRSGRPHRRLDCRPATGGALDAGARRTFPGSSGRSPETTATSWTIWSTRSCSASPTRVRSFLLQTAILDRLSGPLCDAVTGQEDGKARLEALERGNFFVVPLDDKRHWYRYHHLFAEVLSRAFAGRSSPIRSLTLHRRASAWYEQHGSAADAIRHALAAEDFERAADLVELAVPAMRRSRQEATLLGWLKALPDELIRRRPVLSVAYAQMLLASGELEGVEDRLRDAERWLDTTADRRARPDAPAAAMVVVDDEAFRRLPGAIAVARAGQALALGDVPATVTLRPAGARPRP